MSFIYFRCFLPGAQRTTTTCVRFRHDLRHGGAADAQKEVHEPESTARRGQIADDVPASVEGPERQTEDERSWRTRNSRLRGDTIGRRLGVGRWWCDLCAVSNLPVCFRPVMVNGPRWSLALRHVYFNIANTWLRLVLGRVGRRAILRRLVFLCLARGEGGCARFTTHGVVSIEIAPVRCEVFELNVIGRRRQRGTQRYVFTF